MTPRTVATIGLRILAIWVLLEALFGFVSIIFLHREMMAGFPGIHRRYYDGGQHIADGGLYFYLHDTYYIASQFAPFLVGVGLRLAAGLILLLASKGIARIVSRRLESV